MISKGLIFWKYSCLISAILEASIVYEVGDLWNMEIVSSKIDFVAGLNYIGLTMGKLGELQLRA